MWQPRPWFMLHRASSWKQSPHWLTVWAGVLENRKTFWFVWSVNKWIRIRDVVQALQWFEHILSLSEGFLFWFAPPRNGNRPAWSPSMQALVEPSKSVPGTDKMPQGWFTIQRLFIAQRQLNCAAETIRTSRRGSRACQNDTWIQEGVKRLTAEGSWSFVEFNCYRNFQLF